MFINEVLVFSDEFFGKGCGISGLLKGEAIFQAGEYAPVIMDISGYSLW